jgi:ribosomal protein S18 acetylase RimI-like enzyme
MQAPEWREGRRPLDLEAQQVAQVLRLFLEETGEQYSESSVRHLPIPAWGGNMLLRDPMLGDSAPIQGVFWATPFKDDIVRVAAFVIEGNAQRLGHGGRAWDRFTLAAWNEGYRYVQLEVKAANLDAQRFYEARGLTVHATLEDYYQSGLGYMMRGPLPRPNEAKDYSP